MNLLFLVGVISITSNVNIIFASPSAQTSEIDIASPEETKYLDWIFCCKELRQKIDSLQSQFDSLLPTGYIYIQFSGQASPTTMFPTYTWLEVTSQYSGQFFRAAGGNAAPFGTVQGESSPKITKIAFGNAPIGTVLATSTTVIDGTSPLMFVSSGGPGLWDGIMVTATGYGTEVRPVNQAIKIWQRM